MAASQIIIDHLSGSFCGQRQEFQVGASIQFGRHPDSDVCFHSHRDRDASSRHAVLDMDGDHYILRDVGSSNGTFVNEQLITELIILPGEPVIVEFGSRGPRVRVFIGDPATAPPVPRVANEHALMSQRIAFFLVCVMVIIMALAIAAWIVLV